MAVDALGNPLRWHLTGGEVHDVTQAPALLAGLNAKQVIADKGYDSDAVVACITATGAQAVNCVARLDPMIVKPTVSAISSSVSSVVSSSFAGSPRAMKSLHATSYQCSTWPPPISGWRNC
jgi:transposase